MQSTKAFQLFIALVSLITFHLPLTAQIDSTEFQIDSINNYSDFVDTTSGEFVLTDSTEVDTIVDTELSDDAIESQVNYNARDTIKYNFAESKVYLYGDAIVTYEDVRIAG